MTDTTRGPFQIVLADPPWEYASRPQSGSRFGGGAQEQYLDHDGDGRSTLTLDEIAALPVSQIVAPDAYLFMWATWPTLWESVERNAFRVMERWGFEYRTLAFLWVKIYQDGRPRYGQGWYLKANSEACLLGVRGRPWKQTDSISQILDAGAPPAEILAPVTRHSEKPAVVRDKILEFCGASCTRLELFARVAAPGWLALGNEITGCDIRDDLRDVARSLNVWGRRTPAVPRKPRPANDGQLSILEALA